MRRITQLCRELGLTTKLYLRICLCLLILVLLQWQSPVAGLPAAGRYAYQYGVFYPWLDIYKTADLGRLHLFQALTTGDNLGTANWLLYPGTLFLSALAVFLGIGIVKYFLNHKKVRML